MQIGKTAVLKHLGFGRENEDKVPVADRGEKGLSVSHSLTICVVGVVCECQGAEKMVLKFLSKGNVPKE